MLASLAGYVLPAAFGAALLINGFSQGLGEGTTALALGGIIASGGCASFMHFISLIEARSSLVIINDAPRARLWSRLWHRKVG